LQVSGLGKRRRSQQNEGEQKQKSILVFHNRLHEGNGWSPAFAQEFCAAPLIAQHGTKALKCKTQWIPHSLPLPLLAAMSAS
jgi:hypothetical protein